LNQLAPYHKNCSTIPNMDSVRIPNRLPLLILYEPLLSSHLALGLEKFGEK
jgi:hypothetical protein